MTPIDNDALAARVNFAVVEEADFDKLVALRIAAMRQSLERVGRFDPERARQRLQNSFYPEHTQFILFDGQQVGFFTFRLAEDGFHLDHLYVHPHFQSRGIGAYVLQHVLAQSDAQQRPVRLGALRDSPSIRFYQRHGFVQTTTDEWDIYYIRQSKPIKAESREVKLGDFSVQADAYRRARPTYPEAIIDLLINDAKVVAGDAVVDFGAGTGIFTRLLTSRGFRVSAIEPNDEMRSNNDAVDAQWINGTFESSQLEDSSQRWAVAAQAFHWADPQRTLPEVRRVLEPSCIFSVVWNNRANQESEILDWTENMIRRHVPEFDEAYRNRPWQMILESTGDFEFLSHHSVVHTITMSTDRYLTLWESHNRLNVIAGPERFQILLHEIDDYLRRKGLDEVDVPYGCEAWSARRRDS